MANIIQLRRGYAAEWSSINPIIADGELCVESDTEKFKIGNGIDRWNDLAYATGQKGDKGDTGAAGTNGIDGINGTNGIDGKDGKDGVNGAMGGTQLGVSRLNVMGVLSPRVGITRWYPSRTITLININANVGMSATNQILIDVKKNGISILQNPIAIAPNNYKSSTLSNLNISVGTMDYITIDIISASGGGQNLNVTFEYLPELGSVVNTARLNFLGNIKTKTGSARWYPNKTITISKIFATLSNVSSGSIGIAILKNDVIIHTLSIIAGNYLSEIITNLNEAISSDDYITCNILSSDSGQNLTITLEYI